MLQSKPTTSLALPSFTLAVLLAGCGGGGSNGGGPGSPSPAPAAPLFVSATTPSGLTATLAESTATVAVGGTVTYTLTLTNNTTQPVTFVDALNSDGSGVSPGYLGITDTQGHDPFPGVPVPAVAVPAPTTTYTLPPGQSLSQTLPVIFSIPAGSYIATAEFPIMLNITSPIQLTAVGPLAVTVQ